MGPLKGLRIIEIGSIGPGPFCAMLLADMGADVVRIDRYDGAGNPVERDPALQVMHRNRRSLAMNLKKPDAVRVLLKICASADGLIEGFRPGVMERLGLGPESCFSENPRLVYGRMTGWGQNGPLSRSAGHDINYLAISGVLSLLGRNGEQPHPPLNIVADMGGGGLLLAFGMVCALLESRASGEGQVVDAAMVEGSALMASTVYGLRAAGWWKDQRGENLLDGGAPFYQVYETRDGEFMAIGAIEPRFYSALVRGMGLDESNLPDRMDTQNWPELKKRFAEIFKTRTRGEWTAVFEGGDACASPVLSLEEAASYPHNVARQVFTRPSGVLQAAPAPRFSRSAPEMYRPPPRPGQHSGAVLKEFGFTEDEIAAFRDSQTIR